MYSRAFKIQHVFEETHTEQVCRRIVDEYTRCGKDGGVTLKHIRHACGLPEGENATTSAGHLLATSQEHEEMGKAMFAECVHEVYKHYINHLYFPKDHLKMSASYSQSNAWVSLAKDYYTVSMFNSAIMPEVSITMFKGEVTESKLKKLLWDLLCKDELHWTTTTTHKVVKVYPKLLMEKPYASILGRVVNTIWSKLHCGKNSVFQTSRRSSSQLSLQKPADRLFYVILGEFSA